MVVGGDPLAFSSLLYLVPELKGLEGSKSWQQLGLSLVYLTHGLPMGPGLLTLAQLHLIWQLGALSVNVLPDLQWPASFLVSSDLALDSHFGSLLLNFIG